MEDYILQFFDDQGYYFLIPPRSVWRKFCEEMEFDDFDDKYKPEEDDFVLIVRQFKKGKGE